MQKPIFNGPPSPEEFQRQLQEFMRQHLPGGNVSSFTRPDTSDAPEGSHPESKSEEFKFDYKPRDVKAYLDRFVVKQDRKSTRLNSSHLVISYAVFCLKKKYVQVYNILL